MYSVQMTENRAIMAKVRWDRERKRPYIVQSKNKGFDTFNNRLVIYSSIHHYCPGLAFSLLSRRHFDEIIELLLKTGSAQC